MSERPALRAPAGDGEILSVPPLGRAADLVALNRARLASGPVLLGRSFAEIRDLARRELLAPVGQAFQPASSAARQAGKPDLPLFLAGHQPELFHPGVWVKNFALAGLARRHGGAGVNLLIDNDTVKSTSLRVPAPGDPPRVRDLPFDSFLGETPWEERRVHDPATFARFGDEASAVLRGWGYEPLLSELWPVVLRSADGPVGMAFAAARQSIERRWGCDNREVPISALSQGEGFATFAGAILADLERFHGIYNGVVRAYRARHRIRSRNHPVPDLLAQDGWLEAPLWGWRAGGRRGRLLARIDGDRLRLRTGQEEWPALPSPRSRAFVADWRDLARAGHKVRPRALATTLFARLFLADVFIHGIGGAVYDELTDEVIRRFFALRPPEFLVLSATVRLPLPASPDTADDRRRLARRLRDIEHNPQRHLSGEQADALAPLLEQRREWVARRPHTKAGRRERFRQLRRHNDELRTPLAGAQQALRQELGDLDRRLAVNAALRRRDYSFCLYPESALRPVCARLLALE